MDNTMSHNALLGTRTADNLMNAFRHESEAAMRSGVYSAQAAYERDMSTRRMLDEMSDNGAGCSELWLGYLDGLDATSQNLKNLSKLKREINGRLYEDMAEIADEEGFHEIAEKFRMAKAVSNNHAKLLDDRAKSLEGDRTWETDTEFRCPVCGFTVTGNTMPESCPLCTASF